MIRQASLIVGLLIAGLCGVFASATVVHHVCGPPHCIIDYCLGRRIAMSDLS